MNLTVIEKLAKDYADARSELSDLVLALTREQEDVTRRAMPRIKAKISAAAMRRNSIQSAVEDHPDLFVKPRTVIFHGIKIGLEKGKGKIEIPDEPRTISLIEKKLPDQLDALAPSYRALLKTALKTLSVADLKAIGCTVEETGDQVIIRPVDKDLDRMVNALIKSATDESQTQEAA